MSNKILIMPKLDCRYTSKFYYLILHLVPEKVQSIRSTAITNIIIALQWDEVEGTATETYSLTWTSNYGGRSLFSISGTSAVIVDLPSNTMYSFQIKAVNAGGEGELSDEYNVATSK